MALQKASHIVLIIYIYVYPHILLISSSILIFMFYVSTCPRGILRLCWAATVFPLCGRNGKKAEGIDCAKKEEIDRNDSFDRSLLFLPFLLLKQWHFNCISFTLHIGKLQCGASERDRKKAATSKFPRFAVVSSASKFPRLSPLPQMATWLPSTALYLCETLL